MARELIYRQATLDEIHRLRFAILRPGLPVVRVYFTGDDQMPPLAWHFGAFYEGGGQDARVTGVAAENVGCLTLLATKIEGRDAMQLRGMAVATEWQSRGVGSKLLAEAEAALAREGGGVRRWPWWCNARIEAIAFYQRNGWRVISDEFMVEGVGPHRKMSKDCGNRA